MIDPILYVGDSIDIKQILNESDKKIDAVQNGINNTEASCSSN